MNFLDLILIATLCFIAHLIFVSSDLENDPRFKVNVSLAENQTLSIDIQSYILTDNYTIFVTPSIDNSLNYAIVSFDHEMMDDENQNIRWSTFTLAVFKPAHLQNVKLFCVRTNQTLTCKWH